MIVGYWLLAGFLVLLIVALGIVSDQRDRARTNLDLYRSALIRVDPEEARALAFVSGRVRTSTRRSPLLCRLGLHKWRRRATLTTTVDPDTSDLAWPVKCDRCDANRGAFRGVAR